jgi:hypothetical protein
MSGFCLLEFCYRGTQVDSGNIRMRAMFDCTQIVFAFVLLSKKQFPYNKPVFNGSYGQLLVPLR